MNARNVFQEWDTKLQGRSRDRRKVENNTYLERRGESIALKLHETDVVTAAPDGTLTMDTGGWFTVTTKDRINGVLRLTPFRIGSERGVWYWFYFNGEGCNRVAPYSDKDRILLTDSGYRLDPQTSEIEADKRKRFLASIREYAGKCSAALPLKPPGAGDCLYCQMETADGKALGDRVGAGHLLDHMKEAYIVPSLVYRALKEAGNGDLIIAAAFGQAPTFLETTRDRVRRAVSKYIQKRCAAELA